MLVFRISLLVILSFSSVIAETPEIFWSDFETAKKNKVVSNVVEYVHGLATQPNTDDFDQIKTSELPEYRQKLSEQMKYKKAAILWFMTTGGKYGFRQQPATQEELGIMVDALIFIAILHEDRHHTDLLSIDTNTGNTEVKTHLLLVQKILTATRIMFHGSNVCGLLLSYAPKTLGDYVKELFNKEYLPTVLHLKNLKSITPPQYTQEAQEFSDIFVLGLDQREKRVFNKDKLLSSFFGFKEPATEASAAEFRKFIAENCIQGFESFEQNGFSNKRTTPPKLVFRPKYEKTTTTVNGSEKISWKHSIPTEQGNNSLLAKFSVPYFLNLSQELLQLKHTLAPGGGYSSVSGSFFASRFVQVR